MVPKKVMLKIFANGLGAFLAAMGALNLAGASVDTMAVALYAAIIQGGLAALLELKLYLAGVEDKEKPSLKGLTLFG